MLNMVTITGADDATPIADLLALSNEFPFVEWGILASKKLQGSTRFPSYEWLIELARKVAEYEAAHDDAPRIKISMHLCGEWVRRAYRGTLAWEDLPLPLRSVAQRIQLNTHAEEHVSTVGLLDFMGSIGIKQFIIQLDGLNDHVFDACLYRGLRVAGLFDASHGAGRLPDHWPRPNVHSAHFGNPYFGYAGGLSPENIGEQLPRIAEARGPHPFWVDMEGRFRNVRDSLDLNKVSIALATCSEVVP